MNKNLLGKTRPQDQPYATFKGDGVFGPTEIRVLKGYQSPAKEAGNPHARWFVATKTDYTFGSFELGDCYIADVKRHGLALVQTSPEWDAQYGG